MVKAKIHGKGHKFTAWALFILYIYIVQPNVIFAEQCKTACLFIPPQLCARFSFSSFWIVCMCVCVCERLKPFNKHLSTHFTTLYKIKQQTIVLFRNTIYSNARKNEIQSPHHLLVLRMNFTEESWIQYYVVVRCVLFIIY